MKEQTDKRKKIIMIVVAAILVIAAVAIFLYFNSKIRATTMRILRIEGEVTLEDDGKPKSITDNIRLNSGNALSTAVRSLVSIGLDEVKIVTLDEKSRAVFNQKGRQLDLELTDGSLFFEVQQPLEDDESMDIRTSTMVVGIRGTSGWVSVDGEHESLIVTDGRVHVIGTNPVTGEVKEIDVKAGQRVTVYLYNDRKVDSIMFVLEEVTERDLPEFLLDRLRENPELLEKVCRETGWDKPWILGIREEDIPKVIIDSNETNDTDGSDDTTEVEDTAENEIEESEANEKTEDEVLTKEELAWAHSHIMFTDQETGIFALKDTTLFDPAFYAATNPDVVAKYGTDPDALLWHYLQRGRKEGRPPIAPPTPTPTPTPWWLYPQEKTEEPEDDDDDESDHDSTQSQQTTSISNATWDPGNTGQVNFPGNKTGTFNVMSNPPAGTNYQVSLNTPEDISLPFTVDGLTPGVPVGIPGGSTTTYPKNTADYFGEIDWTHSGNGQGGPITVTKNGDTAGRDSQGTYYYNNTTFNNDVDFVNYLTQNNL